MALNIGLQLRVINNFTAFPILDSFKQKKKPLGVS